MVHTGRRGLGEAAVVEVFKGTAGIPGGAGGASGIHPCALALYPERAVSKTPALACVLPVEQSRTLVPAVSKH